MCHGAESHCSKPHLALGLRMISLSVFGQHLLCSKKSASGFGSGGKWRITFNLPLEISRPSPTFKRHRKGQGLEIKLNVQFIFIT